MNPSSTRRPLTLLAPILLIVLGLANCSKPGTGILKPNLPPTVEFTQAPVSPDRSNAYLYYYQVNWSGNDPDGRIDHYEYATDPTATDTAWISTPLNERIIRFTASQADSSNGGLATSSDFHTFVIKAVDDDGAQSPRVSRAFFSFTIAPNVNIRNPIPQQLLSVGITPSVRIEWSGDDPDGEFTKKPKSYKWKLLNLSDPASEFFRGHLDTFRDQSAATGWAGWTATGADEQFVQLTDLVPDNSYMFCVVAFDEAGAYSPLFSRSGNCLVMRASVSVFGPKIQIFNSFIDFSYTTGGYSADASREIPIEVPTAVAIPVNWTAEPSPGSRIQSFRWMVDGNINDQSQRLNEADDYVHWSRSSPTNPGFVLLRPLPDGIHRFYLECTDNNNITSLGILKMTTVTPTFDKELLVVNDTRLEVDKFRLGCPTDYTLEWPARSELDTFLFARGNVPWRCTVNPATGVTSPPGLLAGYTYDTLGTRRGLPNPVNTVQLSTIGQYKRLLWLVDAAGGGLTFNLDQGIYPVTALYAMSGPGRASTLGAYTQLGGQVWLAGGGAAYASLIQFDKPGNDVQSTKVFTNPPPQSELVAGRIMYDGAHWQSSVAIVSSGINTVRNDYTIKTRWADGSLHDTTHIVVPEWSHAALHQRDVPGLVLRRPDYSKLPVEMRWRQNAGDPLTPTRRLSRSSLFYVSGFPCEYIRDANFIIEDVNPDAEQFSFRPVLDTLFMAQSPVLLTSSGRAPTMTYYHGAQARQFVFSGFAPWGYARQDCMKLFDFVLHEIWGMSRDPVDRGSSSPSLRNGGSLPARIVTPAQRTVSARVPTGTTRE
jgi:hypothetical protein